MLIRLYSCKLQLYMKLICFWTFSFQVLTVGALHQADSVALNKAASAWHNELGSLPKPLVVVNIGGPSSNYLAFTNLLCLIA